MNRLFLSSRAASSACSTSSASSARAASSARPGRGQRSGARRATRTAIALGVVAGTVLLVPGTAGAHVTVSSTDAAAGGFGKLVFRVPTESDVASTTSLTIELPAATPFAFVTAQLVPGWTVETEKETFADPVEVGDFTLTEAVRTVTWTADDGVGIPPGQFAEFGISVGPFPADGGDIVLPTAQTYSDGEVVAWDDVETGGAEAERPAPTLALAPAAAEEPGTSGSTDDADADTASDGDAATGDPATDDAATDDSSTDGDAGAAEGEESSGDGGGGDTAARLLGGGGLAAGLAALVLAVRRRP